MNSADNTLFISKPEIFSFSECLRFLDRGYDDCLYTFRDKSVLKPLKIEDQQGLVEVSESPEALKVELISGALPLTKVARYVTEWFDLNRNLQPFYQLIFYR